MASKQAPALADGDQTARVVELRVSNFARIKTATIRPDPGGGLVEITGRNAQGKTSILNAIKAALKGKGAAPLKAIRKGAEEATLYTDLGPIKILRQIAQNKHGEEEWSLKVVAADGTRIARTPQAVIDAFRAELGFDPLGFARLKAREQFDVLRRMLPGVDFDKLAAQRLELYEQRTFVNRRLDEERALAAAITLPPGRKPAPISSVEDKLAELGEALRYNESVLAAAAERARNQQRVEAMRDEAEQLRARAATLERQADEQEQQAKSEVQIPLKDIDTIRSDINSARAIEKTRSLFENRDKHEAAWRQHSTKSDELTQAIATLDKRKADAIAAAKLPVANLSLGDGEVLLNDLPLVQAGTAERIEACVAIAMALNPSFKVVLIDEGSELDSAAREIVRRMAAERGYDAWITRVEESGEVGFFIEDGELAS